MHQGYSLGANNRKLLFFTFLPFFVYFPPPPPFDSEANGPGYATTRLQGTNNK
jgi:hypothetical protein